MIWILVGPPGSGKGTQADRMKAAFGLEHISTGDLLRAEVARGSATGERVKAIMARGDLVPDATILELVRDRLAANGGPGFVLDGFPRTVDQARALDALLSSSGRSVDLVITFEVPDGMLVERLLGRAGQQGRPDDTREAIVERMHEYRAQTAPVIAFYRSSGRAVADVDGVGTPDMVFARVCAAAPVSASGRVVQ